MILVVGATGNVGGQVARQLSDRNLPVRALLRDPQAANVPMGVERVRGDLSRPETFSAALDGVDEVFLMLPPASSNIPAFAQQAGGRVHRIVFVSSSAVRDGEPPINPLAAMHADVEKAIQQSGAEWTILRPGAYATNTLGWWGPQLRKGDVLRWPFATLQLAPVDPRDIATVAVRALTDDGHVGAKYVVTGPQALTFAEQLEVIGDTLGRELRFEEVPREAARELLPNLPPPVLNTILDTWQGLLGKPPTLTKTFEEVTGSPARTFGDWVRQNADAFRRAA